MQAHVVWRKVHGWLSMIVAIPLLVIIATGLLLQVKKDFPWIQPTEERGGGGAPHVSFADVLATCAAQEELNVRGWEDIRRVDLRPDKALLKVTTQCGREVQIDPADGRVLRVAYRRSDVIEALHDGSWFGSVAKRFVFLPTAIALLVLWSTGIYLFFLPHLRTRKQS